MCGIFKNMLIAVINTKIIKCDARCNNIHIVGYASCKYFLVI